MNERKRGDVWLMDIQEALFILRSDVNCNKTGIIGQDQQIEKIQEMVRSAMKEFWQSEGDRERGMQKLMQERGNE